jgi:hypothetical protein
VKLCPVCQNPPAAATNTRYVAGKAVQVCAYPCTERFDDFAEQQQAEADAYDRIAGTLNDPNVVGTKC